MGSAPSKKRITVHLVDRKAIYVYPSYSGVYPSYPFPENLSLIDSNHWKRELTRGKSVLLSLSGSGVIEQIDGIDVIGAASRKGPTCARITFYLPNGTSASVNLLFSHAVQTHLTNLMRDTGDPDAQLMLEYLDLEQGG
jgi:hypothetical protein